jgi:hypothetical protein
MRQLLLGKRSLRFALEQRCTKGEIPQTARLGDFRFCTKQNRGILYPRPVIRTPFMRHLTLHLHLHTIRLHAWPS